MLQSRTDYTVAEIAAMMGISIPTIYRHAKRGLVGLKKIGGRTLIGVDEFNRYREGHAPGRGCTVLEIDHGLQ